MKAQLSLTLTFAHLLILLISKTYGFTMNMIPIDSPHLQILPQHFTAHHRHELLTNISLSRAYNARKGHPTPDTNSFAFYPYQLRGFYISTLYIGQKPGSGPRPGDGSYVAHVVLDTGDHETWIQCQGCQPCFTFEGEKYDFRDYVTFTLMASNDRLCSPHLDYHGCCAFSNDYGLGDDHPQAKGMVGRESFFFWNPNIRQFETYTGLAFGCGFENTGFDSDGSFVGPNNRISGIHGLAPGPRSFFTQLRSQIKGRFSYCLPPLIRTSVQYTTMYFGDDAQIRGDATRRLQAITLTTTSRYYMSMTGISVNGIRLPIDPSIFVFKRGEPKGVIIDCGSPYTFLAKTAYDPLHNAVIDFFARTYGWQPIPYNPEKIKFKSCYRSYPPDEHGMPSIIFHFYREGQAREANMVFRPFNMFVMTPLDGTSVMCLAVLEINDPGPCLIGATQQADFRFLYDVYNSLLYFVPETCVN